tara:strand:- start:68 stop:865 length:798 start_codon:yes stop_codon:yes gene_type:complete
MKTCTSISGGQSSAYIAKNYPTDLNVFALVTTNDIKCKPKDKGLIKLVSQKIGREFISTLEDDIILNTIFDLEQEIGNEITWVAGKPFEDIIQKKSGYLPNVMVRYCTTHLKIDPMFNWWKANFKDPIIMNIGFRAGESRRASNMLEKCNDDGLRAYGKTFWQKPNFPMIENNIRRDKVVNYWKGKNVRFAAQNNCVGCFHRNPLTLRKMFDLHPNKMEWFINEEAKKSNQFKSEISYKEIKAHKPQHEINFDEIGGCDSGYCGL